MKDFALPLLKADAVVYQSGLVAIEGDLELGVDVKTDRRRRADVGQLAIAKYTPASLEPNRQQPGSGLKQSPMRLLGTYEFVGETPKVAVDVVRNPSYALTPAIVQRATLTTLLSADGTSQTKATFQLRTKAAYLEVELPENAVALVGRAGRHAAEAAEARRDSPDRPAARLDRRGAESATRL